MENSKREQLRKDALIWHSTEPLGAISVEITKDVDSVQKLALAYSPGVAEPCKEIEKDADNAYLYTGKGNSIAMISNGTAVLGLGNIGALASKPVMEGKSLLLKKFGHVNCTDIEIDCHDPEKLIDIISAISVTWGGINLEDIKAPECFIIEAALKEKLNIPVFHDDQHGTAIAVLAGLKGALAVQGKDLADIKIVINGAGAASISCANLLVKTGVRRENVFMCDSKGLIYKGRAGLNEWKERYARDEKIGNGDLAAVVKDADVFMGLSVKGALTQDMVLTMAKKPIIFAMANPDPEITPEEVREVRSDAVIATGRSDYPNQVNNLLAFPYIFRGALDARATDINDEMKIAAAEAITSLIDDLSIDNILPSPLDERLYKVVSTAVVRAAMESGVARLRINDWKEYHAKLDALKARDEKRSE